MFVCCNVGCFFRLTGCWASCASRPCDWLLRFYLVVAHCDYGVLVSGSVIVHRDCPAAVTVMGAHCKASWRPSVYFGAERREAEGGRYQLFKTQEKLSGEESRSEESKCIVPMNNNTLRSTWSILIEINTL